MKEQLISFDTAKLAKEKGIDFICYDGYTKGGRQLNYRNNWWKDRYMYAPTQSLLQKRLREEKDIHIEIGTDRTSYPKFAYNIIIFKEETIEWESGLEEGRIWSDLYRTYEEALEEGLKESLKLI